MWTKDQAARMCSIILTNTVGTNTFRILVIPVGYIDCSQHNFEPGEKDFKNIERKEENAGHQHFLLFPQCFLPLQKQISIFELSIKHFVLVKSLGNVNNFQNKIT